jgi:hypothetical protein
MGRRREQEFSRVSPGQRLGVLQQDTTLRRFYGFTVGTIVGTVGKKEAKGRGKQSNSYNLEAGG